MVPALLSIKDTDDSVSGKHAPVKVTEKGFSDAQCTGQCSYYQIKSKRKNSPSTPPQIFNLRQKLH